MDGLGRRHEGWRWLLIPVMFILLVWLAYDITSLFVAGQRASAIETRFLLLRLAILIIVVTEFVQR
jgi:hypothetical protein